MIWIAIVGGVALVLGLWGLLRGSSQKSLPSGDKATSADQSLADAKERRSDVAVPGTELHASDADDVAKGEDSTATSSDVEQTDAETNAEAVESPGTVTTSVPASVSPAPKTPSVIDSLRPPSPSWRPPPTEREAYQAGLARTRGGFVSRLAGLFGKKSKLDQEVFDEIEEVLLTSDLGVRTADLLLQALKDANAAGQLAHPEDAWRLLRSKAQAMLQPSAVLPLLRAQPTVILLVGVNGVGKTTTIGKLAASLKAQGKNVLLAAGDTFRAAAVLQLEVWGKRVGAEVVKGKEGADPSSVMFDAVRQALDANVDVLLCDTAGRLHTKAPLMQELEKVGRTVEKALGRPADEVWLVVDATTGQNAMQQAQLFREALPLSGIVLTKLDGSAKGGVVIGIANELGIPVRYVGLGERVEDLRAFEAEIFADELFAPPAE